jgi:nucleoid-associated protein YgaU
MDRYKRIDIIKNSESTSYRRNVIFPKIPARSSDIYVISTAGDRFDTLALEYYGDSTLWWIIAGINNGKKDSLAVKPGVQLRIPSSPQRIIDAYEELNNER